MGWESLYSLPGDVYFIYSTNLHWTYYDNITDLLEQVVVVSKVRVIVTLRDHVSLEDLVHAMAAHNEAEGECFRKLQT
eukprot:2654137-Alexandrium_andersonii.AAC.1